MQNINDVLLDMGFEWAEIDSWDTAQKRFLLAWEQHDWKEVLALHKEHGLGTPDEIEMAERYRERS